MKIDAIESYFLNTHKQFEKLSFHCLIIRIFKNTIAIKSIPAGKAAGINGISAEFYKSNPYMAAEVLQPILEEGWLSEAFPEEWTDGIKRFAIIGEKYVFCPPSSKSSARSYWIG